jgi:uncharacterized Zn finger protein
VVTHPLSTPDIWIECSNCDEETLHVEEGDERTCTKCGQVNEYLDWDYNAEHYYWTASS